MGELRYLHLGFGDRAVPYERGWAEQRRVHAARVAGEVGDTCLLLEHQAVYTAGRRTQPWDRPTDGSRVVEVDRGGRITWHGPGQLVGYPIVALPQPVDVVAHVRRLEEAVIRTCAEFGLSTGRVDGRSGVWTGPNESGPNESGPNESGPAPRRKVCAIGVRVAQGVTMHGFALNCDCDLGAFDRIVPCGITDAGVSSLTAERGRPVPVSEARAHLERHLAVALGTEALPGREVAGSEAARAM